MFNERERSLLPAQFALRVAILSGIALVMFSIIFFRLWYLQVLSSDDYLKQAQNNQVREVNVQAPRGEILDRKGQVLVDNRTALALQILPPELPQKRHKQREEFARLSHVINMPTDRIEKQIKEQTKDLPSNPVTLRRDVGYDLVYYLRENQDEYPGVTVQRVYVRNYPDGNLGAQIYGYVREVTGPQLKEARYQGLQPGDQVGQSGIENTYDNVLRGANGTTRVQVDAAGNPTGRVLNQVEPKPGDNLVLSIDRPVQEAGEQAIGSFSTPGAFVAMNARNGEILGLGSSPTFDPAVFSKPVIPESVYQSLVSESTSSPLTNRAIQGLYPTGSTFKPITAIAALESGVLTPTTTINDGGSFDLGDGTVLHNAGNAVNGALQLPQALQVSSDVFFYNVGADLYSSDNTSAQDKWASDLGIGHPTGIDLPGETAGLLPTPQWRNQLYKEAQSPNSPGGKEIVLEKGETDRPWTMGDNVNLAVGQGDLQADPLQMAVAYAAIGNGGDVVRPHVGMQVEDPNGSVVQDIDPAPIRHLNINPTYTRAILEGIHAAAQEPSGTSYDVFGNFPVPMAGKTGTAQRLGYQDQSWYVCLAPYPNPKIVVAATIEEGGFGVESAAPTARQILTAYYDEHPQQAKKAGGKPPKATPITAGAVVSSPN